jgi:hypothetical protein
VNFSSSNPLRAGLDAGDDEGVSSNWRDEVAVHLIAAASDLRARRDGSFVKSFTVAIGYLEQAARTGISRNAQRIWENVCKTVQASEHTAQMKLTPEAMEEIARRQGSIPDIAPPSMPVSAIPVRKVNE